MVAAPNTPLQFDAFEVALREIISRRNDDPQVPLLRYLNVLRWIVRQRPVETLSRLSDTNDEVMLGLTMLLMRRCRVQLGEILSYAAPEVFLAYLENRPLPGLRTWAPRWIVRIALTGPHPLARQAVRLLQHWNCREVLMQIMLELPEDVQQLVRAPAVPYPNRLERFLSKCELMEASGAPQSSWFAPLPLGAGRPVKSPAWIRRILEHIRMLVRGIPSSVGREEAN